MTRWGWSPVCLLAAVLIAGMPAYPGLSPDGRWSLGIVVLAAGLWMTEALPAFAVALLVIGLQVVVLGRPGMLGDGTGPGWEPFVAPWASGPMWLFLGGLIMARGAERMGLDRWLAGRALTWTEGRPARLLPVLLFLAYGLSMFMSNTATAALMLAILRPALSVLPKESRVPARLLVGLAFAANLGGMGTLIGTPPNAIAAALLEPNAPVDFLSWMMLALPPSLLLLGLLWWWKGRGLALEPALELPPVPTGSGLASDAVPWRVKTTAVVLLLTVILWMTGNWHGIPTGAIGLVPLVVLPLFGVIRAADIRTIDWDVLVLLAGGLSLGVGIDRSGLAGWLAGLVESAGLSLWQAALALAWISALLSNLMSNTAAANILLPVTLSVARSTGDGSEQALVIPVALACSLGMALPISTPPNAIVYASGRLTARDYVGPGLFLFLVGPPLAVGWCALFR
jgi:sodium-dependent dicarboxylate transporter 2/3/5